MLPSPNALLVNIEEGLQTCLYVEFLKSQASFQPKWLFSSAGFNGTPQKKNYHCIDMMFSFTCVYVERMARYRGAGADGK